MATYLVRKQSLSKNVVYVGQLLTSPYQGDGHQVDFDTFDTKVVAGLVKVMHGESFF